MDYCSLCAACSLHTKYLASHILVRESLGGAGDHFQMGIMARNVQIQQIHIRLQRNRLLCEVGVDFSRHHGFNKITTQFS